jgi:hypothetical protein
MSDSQSPQAKRASAQDFSQFSKGDVQTSAEPIKKTDAANGGAWQHQGGNVSDPDHI